MNVLKKILEEIKRIEDEYCHDVHSPMFCMGACSMAADVKEIIRSHMNEAENDGWIPVDDTEHTPKDESYVLVSFSNYNLPDIARYEENEKGGTYYPGDDEQSYLKYGIFVNAWQPLPEPYKEGK